MTIDLKKCEPGTLYADKAGNLYRVVGYCTEPTVTMETLPAMGEAMIGSRITGGISGLMWDGFKRLVKEP